MGLGIAGPATLLDAEVTDDGNGPLIGKNPTLITGHEIAVRAEYAFAGQLDGLTLGAGARHRGESYANDANTLTVPDSTIYDLYGSYQLTEGVRLNLTAINRSEEHTSEIQSLMRISYAVFCLKKKKQKY